MSSSRRTSHQSMEPAEQVAAYLDRLFGNRQGIVAIALGTGGYFDGNRKYLFGHGCMKHRYFAWPSQRAEIITLALRSAKNHDLYVIPNLRSAPNAKKGFFTDSAYCWADLDKVTDATEILLKEVQSQGSFLVHSGRGLHVYIALDGVYPVEIIEPLNRALRDFLEADSKWAENSLLRVPGTLNHKGRALGQESYPVVLEDVSMSKLPPWPPAALMEALGAISGPPTPDLQRTLATKKSGRRKSPQGQVLVPVTAKLTPKDLPQDIRKLLAFNPSTKTLPGDHTRSGQLFRLVGKCIEHGLSDGEIISVGSLSKPAQEKWPDKEKLRRHIERCVNQHRVKHPHKGLSCVAAGCATHMNRPAVAEVQAIRLHFDRHYTSRAMASDTKLFHAITGQGRL
jgi:hypothetical protein